MADAVLAQDNSGTELIFPSDVRLHQHFIMFTAFEYQRADRSQNAKAGTVNGRVVLPMPDTLLTGYNANYDSVELGYLGAKIAEPTTKKIMEMFADAQQREAAGVKNPHQNVADAIRTMSSDLIDKAKGAAGYILLDAFENTQIGAGVQVTAGFARNPHLANLFRGVGFRSHSFAYDFIPKSQEESQALFDIIKFFKKWMHPSYFQAFDNNLFKYPSEWMISFSSKDSDKLFNIGESVLTSFDVDYHANGKPAYFRMADGKNAPVNVRLSMSFTETSIVTQEQIDKGR